MFGMIMSISITIGAFLLVNIEYITRDTFVIVIILGWILQHVIDLKK